jgi:hypothetical protein
MLTNDVQLSGEILAKLGTSQVLPHGIWSCQAAYAIPTCRVSGGALMSCVSISALMLADIKIGSNCQRKYSDFAYDRHLLRYDLVQ